MLKFVKSLAKMAMPLGRMYVNTAYPEAKPSWIALKPFAEKFANDSDNKVDNELVEFLNDFFKV